MKELRGEGGRGTTNLEACPQTAPLELCSIRQEISFLQPSIHFQSHKEDYPQIVVSKIKNEADASYDDLSSSHF
jgi:hypothetical protein